MRIYTVILRMVNWSLHDSTTSWLIEFYNKYFNLIDHDQELYVEYGFHNFNTIWINRKNFFVITRFPSYVSCFIVVQNFASNLFLVKASLVLAMFWCESKVITVKIRTHKHFKSLKSPLLQPNGCVHSELIIFTGSVRTTAICPVFLV